MASTEHCLMCFEALDAELNKRKPLSLTELRTSYRNFRSGTPDSSNTTTNTVQNPAIRRLAASGSDKSTSTSPSSSTSLTGGADTPDTSTSSSSSSPPSASSDSPSLSSAPLFVTWNTVSPHDGETSLRGCIGTFEAQPLADGIPEYAIISAIHDSRFSPISRAELPRLQAAVTLLTDFEEVDDPYDWVVGTHGVRLSFTDKGRRYGSTYLPDVASEQGWNREEALYSLTRKAGWSDKRSRWKTLELKVTRYQGKKAEVEYPEFKKWQEWTARK